MVCVLIGMVGTLVIANMDVSEDTIARNEAMRLKKLIDHLRSESVLSGKRMAIRFSKGTGQDVVGEYRFYYFDEGWKDMDDDVLSPRRLADRIQWKWITADSEKGMIVVDPVGSMSSFTVSLTGQSTRFSVTLDETLDIAVRAIPLAGTAD